MNGPTLAPQKGLDGKERPNLRSFSWCQDAEDLLQRRKQFYGGEAMKFSVWSQSFEHWGNAVAVGVRGPDSPMGPHVGPHPSPKRGPQRRQSVTDRFRNVKGRKEKLG